MTFLQPWLLLLFLPTVLLASLWPAGKLHRPLRAATWIFLILALAHPRWPTLFPAFDLWLLVDRSASIEAVTRERAPEIERLLEKQTHFRAHLQVVDFAENAVWRQADLPDTDLGDLHQTNLGRAVELVLREQPRRNSQSRILLLSDGLYTDHFPALAGALREAEIAFDYRLWTPSADRDWQVTSLRLPDRLREKECFFLEATLDGPAGSSLPYRLWKNDRLLASGEIPLGTPPATVRFQDTADGAGALRYRLEISPPADPLPANNAIESWTVVSGRPAVLLVTAYQDDPLAATLQNNGLEVQTVPAGSSPRAALLAGARLVVLNNVPASSLSRNFQSLLGQFVRQRGGGLLILGGRQAFGTGGYAQTPLEELLPVSTELREEHRKLSTVLAIILDRSGSMAIGAGGGWKKMDLANAGAAAAIRLLGDRDFVTVLAVDSEPHEIVPLTAVGKNRESILKLVRGIVSQGGGIYVHAGLAAAWAILEPIPYGQKHLILFADAADAEEPGDYRTLIQRMREQGATLSVIALGTEEDSDAPLLQEIAALGEGRIYFSQNARDLPKLFSQETVALTHSSFIEAQTPTESTGRWRQISPQAIDWLPVVGAYSLTHAKPEAEVILFTRDEFQAPLVAVRTIGHGRTAAVCFPVSGAQAASVRTWKDYDQFLQTLARWLLADDLPPEIDVSQEVVGNRWTIHFRYDRSLEPEILTAPPRLHLWRPTDQTATWTSQRPEHWQAEIALPPGEPLLGALEWQGKSTVLGPVLSDASLEWRRDPLRPRMLQTVARETGGREIVHLEEAFAPTRQRVWLSLQPWLLLLALVAFLLDLADTRLGLFAKMR